MRCWCLYTQQMSGRAKNKLGYVCKTGAATAIAMLAFVCVGTEYMCVQYAVYGDSEVLAAVAAAYLELVYFTL